MSEYNLESMPINELKQLQKDVMKAISTYEDRQKAEARAKVEALAKEFGFSLSELVNSDKKGGRSSVVPKYQHPENAALTWSGRGRQPKWFREALVSGMSPEDLAIL